MRMKNAADFSSPTHTPPSYVVSAGGELHLSNPGQLALLRGMAEHGAALRAMVRGVSMSPFIRDQDVLTIAPMNGRTPAVGEVVAFIQPDTGRVAIHRVIARAGLGWLVRGDNCPRADGVVMGQDIIGCVTRVERLGREVRLGLGPERAWIAALNHGNGLVSLKKLWRAPRRAAGFALHRLQALPIYRAIGRSLATPIETAEAHDSDLAAAHRMFNPLTPYQRQPPNPNVTNWVAKRGTKVIGFVQFVYHPEDHLLWVGYWLFSMFVWERYRGLGIGQALARRVIEQARDRGAADLFLAVFEDNDPAIRLYRKLGFQRITLPALEPVFEAEKEQFGRRRIVMGMPFSVSR